MKIKSLTLSLLIILLILSVGFKKEKPVLYLIGDSTMASASNGNPIQGWGKYLITLFDTTKISIQNRAISGISSRTYQTKGVHDSNMLRNGMWDSIMVTLKPGDYVLMQFGHNDESPVNDTTRQRGSIRGTGNDSIITYNRFLKRTEIVHTYGWYIRKFITDTRKRGAVPIVCSPIPKNKWAEGKVVRNINDYGKWAAEVAADTRAFYIDVNALVADEYDKEGQDKASATYIVPDKVHTTQAGAALNARIAAAAIKGMKKCFLKKYIL